MAKSKPTVQTGTLPSGAAMASDALTYHGAGYTWGGKGDRPGDWDCSSCMSYILGHDFGLTLPGGGHYGDAGYPGNSHGPDVAAYLSWDGATTLGKNEAPQAGDLVIWPPNGHIGMVTGANEMLSALDTSLGTIASPIGGYGPTNTYLYRRINGVGQTPTGDGGTAGGASSAVNAALSTVVGPVVAGLLVSGGFIAIVVGVIAVGGLIVSAVVGGLLAKAAKGATGG